MAGHSRLMKLDETGTFAALEAHRKELIDPVIALERDEMRLNHADGTILAGR